MARSDLTVPEAAAKAMSLYLLFAIGFKGGVAVAAHGVDLDPGYWPWWRGWRCHSCCPSLPLRCWVR
ncbi:MAG: sodium-dependent bicarbonate transport family permease [Gemmobacter sp.]|nr:sodium-dependent bicarbonate transport family permease [Gemmobacter sp.]